MKISLDEWIDLQKKTIKACKDNKNTIPQTVFIGILKKDGVIESRIRLVSVQEWEKFQKLWEQISGQNNPVCKDYLPPQFFLFCE